MLWELFRRQCGFRDDIRARFRTCLLFPQARGYYSPNDGILPRRESRRTLARTRRELGRCSGKSTKTVLLPPYVSPGELRILLGVDYKSALSLCSVKLFQQRYFWKDPDGRCFECDNKRKILVPFDLVAHSVKLFGFTPVMVDPEPLTPVPAEAGGTPVVVVLGNAILARMPNVTFLQVSASGGRSVHARFLVHADVAVVGEDMEAEFEFLKHLNEKMVVVKGGDLNEKLVYALSSPRDAVSYDPVDSLAVTHRSESKRTDVLVDADQSPQCVAVVLDVEKTAQQGTVGLVLVKRGILRLGMHYVAGSGFGKVKNIFSGQNEENLNFATPGMVVKVGRIVQEGGSFAPEDYLFGFPKTRAWRLAFHRQRIEALNSFQTEGAKLDFANFQFDQVPPSDSGDLTNLREDEDGGDDFEVRGKEEATRTREAEVRRIKSALRSRGSILVEPMPEASAAMAESALVTARWTRRQEAKARHRLEEEGRKEEWKRDMHKVRQLVHGGVVDTGGSVGRSTGDSTVVSPTPLPSPYPVVSLIIKTKSLSQYESLLDAIEFMESDLSVKLPIVHGGIGPVTPTDIIHCEIERKHDPTCRVYALDTGLLPHVGSGEVSVESFHSTDALIQEIRMRVIALKRRVGKAAYTSHLKRRSPGY